jgi:hypothetical protein
MNLPAHFHLQNSISLNINYKRYIMNQLKDSAGKACESQIFDNLIWLNSKEAALYLRKSYGALKVMVHRGQVRARKFQNRLYFKRSELDELIETSNTIGGFKCQ